MQRSWDPPSLGEGWWSRWGTKPGKKTRPPHPIDLSGCHRSRRDRTGARLIEGRPRSGKGSTTDDLCETNDRALDEGEASRAEEEWVVTWRIGHHPPQETGHPYAELVTKKFRTNSTP